MKAIASALFELFVWALLPVGAILFAIGYVIGVVLIVLLAGLQAAWDFGFHVGAVRKKIGEGN